MGKLETAFDWARLAAGLASAAVAPLGILAPGGSPWRVLAIGAAEFGHFIALTALAALLPGGRDPRVRRIARLLGVTGATLALDPIMRAGPVAAALPEQLAQAFGPATPRSRPGAKARPRPLVLADLFRGVRVPKTPPEKMVYVERETGPLTLDFYRPAAANGPAPCVIVIHGGSWQNGNSSQLAELNRYLAARGYAVAAINYRLVPKATFPAQLDDSLAAIDYVKRNAAALGVDGGRLVLLGRSAGGQLALLAAYSQHDPAIRGVVGYYAPVEMRAAVIDPNDPSHIYDNGVIAQYMGGSLTEVPHHYDAATPLNFIGPDTPPTLLIHGRRDRLVYDLHSSVLSRMLAAANRPHLFLRLPWAAHGCDFYFSGPSAQIATYAVEHFLAAVTA